jgi:uncharacterized protein YndB with AHSA1/START domain
MMTRFLSIVFLSLVAVNATAEVTDQSLAGFTSRSVHDFAASPEAVWQALTEDIHAWWNPDHTWSGAADNLFLDAEAGEEFGEELPGGGTVTHLEVVYADPGKLLRLRGSLGPLQAMAVVGVLSVEFAAVGEGTQLTVTYAVGGYAAEGLQGLAGPVDGVIVEQFERLRVHTGE